MTSREAFEKYMYGDEEPTTRIDAQKETRQHFKTWQEAGKYQIEACAEICREFGKTLEVDIGDSFAEEIMARSNVKLRGAALLRRPS